MSLASSMSTRQLLRIARRMAKYPQENIYDTVHKACLARWVTVINAFVLRGHSFLLIYLVFIHYLGFRYYDSMLFETVYFI